MLIGPFKYPSSVVNTLFSTPLEIVKAKPNVLIWPNFVIFSKAAGAYTIAGVTGMVLKWSGVGGNILTTTVGFMDDAAATLARAGMLSTVNNTLDDMHTFYGAGLSILETGANTGGSGGILSVMVDVTLYPLNFTDGVTPAQELTEPDGFVR